MPCLTHTPAQRTSASRGIWISSTFYSLLCSFRTWFHAFSFKSSQEVSNSSSVLAQCCLTSVFRWKQAFGADGCFGNFLYCFDLCKKIHFAPKNAIFKILTKLNQPWLLLIPFSNSAQKSPTTKSRKNPWWKPTSLSALQFWKKSFKIWKGLVVMNGASKVWAKNGTIVEDVVKPASLTDPPWESMREEISSLTTFPAKMEHNHAMYF